LKTLNTYFSYFIFFLLFSANAQHKQVIDSLSQKDILDNKLQKALQKYNFDKALTIIDSIEQYGIKTKDSLFMAYAYDAKVTIYQFQHSISKAKPYIKKNIAIYKHYNYSSNIIESYAILASLIRQEGKLDSSFYYLNKATKYITDTTLTRSIKYLYNQKSLSFANTKHVDSSLYYTFKRIALIKNDNPYELSNAYMELALTFSKFYDYLKALLYINKAIAVLEKSKTKLSITTCRALIMKCNILLHLKQYDDIEEVANKTLKILNQKKIPEFETQLNISLSKLYWNTNQPEKAATYLSDKHIQDKKISSSTLFDFYLTQLEQKLFIKDLNSSIKLVTKLNTLISKTSSLNKKQQFYKLSSNYWAKIKDFKKGYNAQREYLKIVEQINNRQQTYIIYDLENKYQLTKKDEEIAKQQLVLEQNKTAMLKRKNEFRVALFGSLLLLIISLGLVLLYRQNQKIKNKQIESLKARKKLNKLEALIEGEEKERKRIAQDLHDGINGDLSVIKYKITSVNQDNFETKEKEEFEQAVSMLDNAIEQVRHISHNLAPPSLQNFNLIEAIQQYCSKISGSNTLKINFQNYGELLTLNKDTETAIYRIVQEGINNIVKHSKASEALVQINNHDNNLHITIEDNGIGFNINNKYEGLGLKNIRSRIELLKGELSIDSTNTGTSIQINIDLN
jgi:two-component system, NarL family, sensor kinase